MKARIFILGAMLLALAVSPSAMRAATGKLSAPSCHAPTHRHAGRRSQAALHKLALTLPGHRNPSPRLHRIRGKKINAQSGFAFERGRTAPARYLFSFALIAPQIPGGPNPSRGPPQVSL